MKEDKIKLMNFLSWLSDEPHFNIEKAEIIEIIEDYYFYLEN